MFNAHRVLFKLSYAVCVSMVSTGFVEDGVLVQAICLWQALCLFLFQCRWQDDTLPSRYLARVWNQQRTPRCMLHFDIHCAARKEIHEGV